MWLEREDLVERISKWERLLVENGIHFIISREKKSNNLSVFSEICIFIFSTTFVVQL